MATLDIPPEHAVFLRRVFTMALEGIRGELEDYPDDLGKPTRLRREESAYEALLAALEGGTIVPDYDVRVVVEQLAVVIDQDNEHDRVVSEHRALRRLGEQLGRAR